MNEQSLEMQGARERFGKARLRVQFQQAREIESAVGLIAEVGTSVFFVPAFRGLMLENAIQEIDASLPAPAISGQHEYVLQRGACGRQVIGQKSMRLVVLDEPTTGATQGFVNGVPGFAGEILAKKVECLADVERCKGRCGQ